MATGIKDKVAIIGMGCTRFGERWDCGPEELIVEAFGEALGDAVEQRVVGVDPQADARRVGRQRAQRERPRATRARRRQRARGREAHGQHAVGLPPTTRVVDGEQQVGGE